MMGPKPNEHTPPHVGPWVLLLAVLLVGVLVFFPALSAGYYFDDHVQMAMVRGRWALPRSPFDLYNFVDNSQLTHLINEGALPWWSSSQLRLRFLRPLASLLLAVDYSLFPKVPWPSHLHSYAWWFASVFAAHGLFQRVLSRRASWMATILFAFAPSHVIPIAWAANREALISLFFGILSLSATLDWLHLGKPRHAFAAAGAYVLSLSGGEYALSLLGYSLMLGIARQNVPRGRRLVAVLATALPAAGYLVLRGLLGCGAKGAGFYLDPVAMPWAFLEQAPRRYFLNFLDVWCGLGGRALLGTTTTARIGLGFVVVASLAPALVHTFRRLPPEARPNVQGLLGGSLLSIVPMLAVAPAPRLLGVSMLGVASTVALVLETAWWPTSVEPRRGLSEWTALMATVLGFAHFLHAPLTAYLDGHQFRDSTRYFERAVTRTLEQLSENPPSTIVVLRDLGTTYYLPYALQEEYGLHARWSVLAQGPHVLLLRTDAQSLELVAPPDGTLVPLGQDQLFRGKDDPFRVQDTLDVQGMQVTVLETNAAGPRRIRFRFHHPLDDGTITWLTETVDGLKPVTLPEVGFGLPIPKTSDP